MQGYNATTCVCVLFSLASAHGNPNNMHKCGVPGAKNWLRRGERGAVGFSLSGYTSKVVV